MDNYYCLIKIVQNKQRIEVYFVNSDCSLKKFLYNYPMCFTANSLNNIILLLDSHDFINTLSLQHTLYIGKELYKAELALFSSQLYIQE